MDTSKPSNSDIIENLNEQDDTSKEFRDNQIKVNGATEKSLAALHERLGNVPTKEETALIVEQVIKRLLLSKGKLAYTTIIGTGTLTVAIIAIFEGLKILLSWLGFTLISR